MNKLYRPAECVNVNCVAMCSRFDYDFRKKIFGNNPTKCPNYRKGTSNNTITELEKIKEEIIEYRDDEANDIDFEIGAINDIIAIIEKHISEKENKGGINMSKWDKLFNHLNDWAFAVAPDEMTNPEEKERRQIVYDTLQTILNIMINEENKE